MRRNQRPNARPLPGRGPAIAVSLLAVVALTLAAGPAAARVSAPADAPLGGVSWRTDLSAPTGDETNVRRVEGSLRLRDPGLRPASARVARGQGTVLLPTRILDRAVDLITPDLDATVPTGSQVAVDVRGQDGLGRWTEWREARDGSPALLPRAVTRVQTRITLVSAPDGTAPTVHALALSAELDSTLNEAAAAEAVTASVYATREGLVGGTTANGHVIVPNDHFVALPPGGASHRRAAVNIRSASAAPRAARPPRSGTSARGTLATTTGTRPPSASPSRTCRRASPRPRPPTRRATTAGWTGPVAGCSTRQA